MRWTRELWQALQPYATGGVYLNHIGREEEDGADQARAAYGANYQSLAALKQKYDPRICSATTRTSNRRCRGNPRRGVIREGI